MTKTMQTLRALLYYVSVAACFAILLAGWVVFVFTEFAYPAEVQLLFVIAIAWGVFAVAMRPREV